MPWVLSNAHASVMTFASARISDDQHRCGCRWCIAAIDRTVGADGRTVAVDGLTVDSSDGSNSGRSCSVILAAVHELSLRAAVVVALVAVTPLGCGASMPGSDKLVSDIRPGLHVRGAASLSPDDHLTELVVHAGHVYAANSWGGVGVLRLEDDGGLTITDYGSEVYGELRCTSLAVHRSSNTLYCAGDTPNGVEPRTPAIERFSLANPGQPERGEALPIGFWSVSDIEVVGDRLLVHQFQDGLWVAEIGPDGVLSNLADAEVEGNARTSVVVGERVITAFADVEGDGTQLRLYDVDGWTELDRLALAGPPLGMSADADGGDRLAVALGSAGLALVDVGPDALTLTRTLQPPAVVTHALVAGEIAIATTLSGAFAWDLSIPEPRLFGFGAEGTQGEHRDGNMLHGVLHDGELIASDWTWIERWAINPTGDVVALDVPRGAHARPDGPVRWQVRNPGPIPLRAEIWHQREHLFDVHAAADALTEIEIPFELREKLGLDEPTVQLNLRVFDVDVAPEGEPLSTSTFVIVQRSSDDPLPPAVGDAFPTVTFADPHAQLELFTVPFAEGTQTIWFTLDCALMWPEVEDLAWRVRSGLDVGPGTPVILSNTDLILDGFAARRSLDGVRLGLYGDTAPAPVAEANAAFDEDLYKSFFVPELPGDAVIMDYVIDPDARVTSLERTYRGPWSLVVPGPWN